MGRVLAVLAFVTVTGIVTVVSLSTPESLYLTRNATVFVPFVASESIVRWNGNS